MNGPKQLANRLFALLREEKIGEFNAARAGGETADLSNGDFRGLDLRGMNADGLNFSGAYFRGSDLRGIDFRNANLEGASIKFAHISGCYFPKALSATEIRLSLEQGIRMRYDA
ncbi:MAG: pentapeptide repeat-containing protein [Gammaproteobacteria bacterium]|nr:pentapeptide repeat-containing protein [Gammaproteobacteria bacterium]